MIFAETVLAIGFSLLSIFVVYGMIKNRKIRKGVRHYYRTQFHTTCFLDFFTVYYSYGKNR